MVLIPTYAKLFKSISDDTLSQAVCWIAQKNYGIRIILHLLDVFLTIQSPETCGFRTMAILTVIFNRLKIPISKKNCMFAAVSNCANSVIYFHV
jgi:hypothetical protein